MMESVVKSRDLAGEVGPPLPYACINLRRNPFGDLDLAERAELAIVDVASIIARLDNPRYAVQFVGDKGCGKTTHLLAILQQVPHQRFDRWMLAAISSFMRWNTTAELIT